MASAVVLIHGRVLNHCSWNLVRGHLEQLGHQTHVIEIPDQPSATLTEIAAGVVRQTAGIGEDCVLVAHGSSGLLLPTIASMRPVRVLVFLAALIPQNDRSFLDQLADEPDILDPEWIKARPLLLDPSTRSSVADRYLFHDVSLQNRTWAYSTIAPRSTSALLTEVAPSMTSARSLAIVCERDRVVSPDWQARAWRARADANSQIRFIDAGHCPQIATPRETANMIDLACADLLWFHTMKEREEALLRKQQRATNPEPHGQHVDYATFMSCSPLRRQQLLLGLSPRDRARLQAIHAQGWLAAQRSTLNPEQIAFIEDYIAMAESPPVPHRVEATSGNDILVDRALTLFSREEMINVFDMVFAR